MGSDSGTRQTVSSVAAATLTSTNRQPKGGRQRRILDGMRSFHQGIRIRTNLIDVDEHGHWKVNFLHKWVEEKGLDTSLAVDMVALQDNYDVAVVMSGDTDNIPSSRQCNKATTRRAPPASAGATVTGLAPCSETCESVATGCTVPLPERGLPQGPRGQGPARPHRYRCAVLLQVQLGSSPASPGAPRRQQGAGRSTVPRWPDTGGWRIRSRWPDLVQRLRPGAVWPMGCPETIQHPSVPVFEIAKYQTSALRQHRPATMGAIPDA